MSELSDEQLMRRHQDGDSDAFSALFVRHARVLYSALCCLLTDEERAVTVASQTWQDVHRLRSSYRPSQSFHCFLFTLAASRRRAVERESSVSASQPGEPRPVTDGPSLLLALRSLPDSYREVVVLQRCVGLSSAEIAAVLGATEAAVLQRAGAGDAQLAQAGVPLPATTLLPVSPATLDHIARAVLPTVERPARPQLPPMLWLSGLLLCLGLVLSLSLFWVHLRR